MDRILLSLITENRGCFHDEYRAVEVREAGGKYFARATRTYARENPFDAAPAREVSAVRVLELQEAINRVLAQSEINADGRTTTRYHARLGRFVDEKFTVIATSSSAPPREDMVEFIEDPRVKSELKRKLSAVLALGYHVWSHELYKIASACVDEWG